MQYRNGTYSNNFWQNTLINNHQRCSTATVIVTLSGPYLHLSRVIRYISRLLIVLLKEGHAIDALTAGIVIIWPNKAIVRLIYQITHVWFLLTKHGLDICERKRWRHSADCAAKFITQVMRLRATRFSLSRKLDLSVTASDTWAFQWSLMSVTLFVSNVHIEQLSSGRCSTQFSSLTSPLTV